MKEKSQVEDIDRSIYDFKDDEKDAYRIKVRLFYKKGIFQLKILNMVIKKGKRKLPLHDFSIVKATAPFYLRE